MKYIENFPYNNVDKGIEYLKKNKLEFYQKNDKKVIFHVYWYGKITRKQILCINSYLATQNLQKTELWIWLDYKTFNISEKFIPVHKNIYIKKYNPNLEAKGTLFENLKEINDEKYLKFRSDLARIIFLYKHGGLYYDLDMILLEDLNPLLGIEFCYMWANLGYGNNGILRLNKNSKACKEIMKKYVNMLKIKKFYLGFNQLIFAKEIDIMCLPSILFDPVWILHDKKLRSKYSKLNNLDNFFKKATENINIFFENEIFAYHWHSRNQAIIEDNSYFTFIEDKIKNKIKNNNI